jgi:hypothetical protein
MPTGSPSQVGESLSKRKIKIFLSALIILAAAEFVVRGPIRFLRNPSDWNDLSQNYTASKLWLKGQSPSNPENFVTLWKHETRTVLRPSDIRTHLAPPLGGLVVLAPLAALPWKAAEFLWLAILLGAFAASVWALVLAGGFRWAETRALAFVAACLALAPFQTGIANGNTSIVVIGLCVLAVRAAQLHSDVAAGILFGIACSMKPQLGAFFVLYYLVRRRWRVFVPAAAATATLNLIAVLYLRIRGTSWVGDYIHNAKAFATASPIDDFSTLNSSRFTLLNLQVPFFSITGHSSSANLLAIGVSGLLLLAWLYWVIRTPGNKPELLCLGTVAVLSLLPVYHRFYDAAVLIVPLCWCIANTATQQRAITKIVLLLMTPFLAPGAAYLQQLSVRGEIPDVIKQSWWWNCIVLPHETWSLLLLCLILLYAMHTVASLRSLQESAVR